MTEKHADLPSTYVIIPNSDQAGPTDLLKCHDGSSACHAVHGVVWDAAFH